MKQIYTPQMQDPNHTRKEDRKDGNAEGGGREGKGRSWEGRLSRNEKLVGTKSLRNQRVMSFPSLAEIHRGRTEGKGRISVTEGGGKVKGGFGEEDEAGMKNK